MIPAGLNTLLLGETPEYITLPYTLWKWGEGSFGQLGQGSNISFSSPVQVGELGGWVNITPSQSRHEAAVRTDGSLWTWGKNGDAAAGALGLGDVIDRNSPVQVGSLTNWSSTSTGPEHVIAVKTDGTLWTWGYNVLSNLGIGSAGSKSSPVQIGGLNTWASVDGSGSNGGSSFAIKTDTTMWSWGHANGGGKLGLGDTLNRNSPVQITGSGWAQVSSENDNSGAVKTTGRLYTWGTGSLGRTGQGNTTNLLTPSQLGSLTTWASISVGQYATLALKTDGTIWGWGYNKSGILGTGNTTIYSSPVQVGSSTDWASVDIGKRHSAAIKTDGTLWAWGYNSYGQLGQGNTISTSSPVQIGSDTDWITVNAQYFNTTAFKTP